MFVFIKPLRSEFESAQDFFRKLLAKLFEGAYGSIQPSDFVSFGSTPCDVGCSGGRLTPKGHHKVIPLGI